jgi:CRP/FNR family transcriptional regulator
VKAHNVCGPLGQDRQRELYEGRQTWRKREFLFRAGDPAGPVFKIITGIVAVAKRLPDGRRQILGFFYPGELCGYLETEGRYTYEGEAITDVWACSFSRARFKAFTAAHRDLAEIVSATLARKLESVSTHMTVVGQLSSVERAAAFLCELKAHYEERGLKGSTLALPMTRDDIGDYLGVRMETASRAFSVLKRLGIIDITDTAVIVTNSAGLAALARPIASHDA